MTLHRVSQHRAEAAAARPKRGDVRSAVVRAAEDVFMEFGYEGASLAMIAANAGFTKGAVYSNFESKADLFVAAYQSRMHEAHGILLRVVEEELHAANSPSELLDALSSRLVRLLPELDPWQRALNQFRTLARAKKEVAASYRSLYDERIRTLVAVCTSHRKLADVPRERLEVFAVTLLSLINAMSLESSAMGGYFDQHLLAGVFRRAMEGIRE